MGRIKSALVKRTAKKLVEESIFTPGFEDDKKILGSLMPSKRIRNKIAGYLARLKKMQENEKEESMINAK
ncbi:30S ribosomal protein S17e [Candidatus Pacearchaeota archaeon]|nr:30S ribosomal protein S17e [Candidatus Pacearchaeota archaeon]